MSSRTPGAMELTPMEQVVEADNAFGFDVYGKMAGAEPGKNLVFSPYSIASSFSILREGARGDTARQLAGMLHISSTDDLKIAREGNQMLRKQLGESTADDGFNYSARTGFGWISGFR